ncbi:hypothetical protein C8J57DRAFT_1705537 [Mycena rebaudengoi]|nr:hypothetical protein C8J57DRAFT_1705537 [Mycena rebaudengoi]
MFVGDDVLQVGRGNVTCDNRGLFLKVSTNFLISSSRFEVPWRLLLIILDLRPQAESGVDKENLNRAPTTSNPPQKARLQAADPPRRPTSTSFIQLRFQLVRFKGVHRVVQLFLNYTFSNLHMLIQFMFSWSGHHAHVAKVYLYVEVYSGNYKAWHIKRYGRDTPKPDADDEAEMAY